LDVCPPKISAVSKVTGRKMARILKNASGKRVEK